MLWLQCLATRNLLLPPIAATAASRIEASDPIVEVLDRTFSRISIDTVLAVDDTDACLLLGVEVDEVVLKSPMSFA